MAAAATAARFRALRRAERESWIESSASKRSVVSLETVFSAEMAARADKLFTYLRHTRRWQVQWSSWTSAGGADAERRVVHRGPHTPHSHPPNRHITVRALFSTEAEAPWQ